ncbi:MAG: OsmC family protein [Anaerolineales bacterium]
MPVRNGSAEWQGKIREGRGTVRFGSGENAYQGAYGFGSRFEEADGTNPEELIGAAHAACFSMALSGNLGRAGFDPELIQTQASVTVEQVDGSWTITKVHLETQARVPGMDEEAFQEQAKAAKQGCPVSRALAGVAVDLTAHLMS